MTEKELRNKVATVAKKYIGCKESNGSHKQIIDRYNAHKPLARGYAVKYTDEWCATFVSAVAIECGLTDIMPTECGCGAMIALYQKQGRWEENEAITPEVGDVIFYDWQDNGVGDNKGNSDHVGIVTAVNGSTLTITEGNKSEAVGNRTLAVNGRYIRGYGLPNFRAKATEEQKTEQKPAQTSGGLSRTVKWTGEVNVTATDCRKWAGNSAAKLVSYPEILKGHEVQVCDDLKASDGSTWYYVIINGSKGKVFGFVNAKYISKKGEAAQSKKELATGTKVRFTGTTHYTSSYNTAKGKAAKACDAKITNRNMTGAHPYHVVGTHVHGWVNAEDVKEV